MDSLVGRGSSGDESSASWAPVGSASMTTISSEATHAAATLNAIPRHVRAGSATLDKPDP